MHRSVVAGTGDDAVHAFRRYQRDAVKRAVVLQLCRFVDEAILIAEIRFDGE
jgi:hypothetical protein